MSNMYNDYRKRYNNSRYSQNIVRDRGTGSYVVSPWGNSRYSVPKTTPKYGGKRPTTSGTGSNRGGSWVASHTTHPTPNRGSNRGWDSSNTVDRGVHKTPNKHQNTGNGSGKEYPSGNNGHPEMAELRKNGVTSNNMIDDYGKADNNYDMQAVINGGQASQGSPSGSGSLSGSYVKFPDPYELDLSIFDQMMKTLGDNYNRSKGVLADQLKTALDSLASSRKRGNQNFHAGRATIAENSYDRQRALANDLASRGLAGSGLQQLGDVQEAMAKGREVSNLASKFYQFLDQMQENENRTRDAHNANLVNLENAYNSGIASIGQQKWQAKNQYDRDMMNRMDEMARFNAQMSARNASNNTSQGMTPEEFNSALKANYDLFTQGVDPEYALSNISGLISTEPTLWQQYKSIPNLYKDFENFTKARDLALQMMNEDTKK